MKKLTFATIAAIAFATTASADVCSWVDRVDIAGSAKASALLSGGLALATTMNPAVAVANGVVTGAVVGGSLYAVDYTCYVFEEHNVVENTTAFATKAYAVTSDYAAESYNYLYSLWKEEDQPSV
jgi:ABC-type multidrug transport system permease subunit